MSPIGQQGFWSVFACRVYCAEIFWFLWFPHLRKFDYFFIKRSKICIVFFLTRFFVIVYPCNVSIAYSHISFHFGKNLFWVQQYPSTREYPAIVHLQTIYVLLAVPVIVEHDWISLCKMHCRLRVWSKVNDLPACSIQKLFL